MAAYTHSVWNIPKVEKSVFSPKIGFVSQFLPFGAISTFSSRPTISTAAQLPQKQKAAPRLQLGDGCRLVAIHSGQTLACTTNHQPKIVAVSPAVVIVSLAAQLPVAELLQNKATTRLHCCQVIYALNFCARSTIWSNTSLSKLSSRSDK